MTTLEKLATDHVSRQRVDTYPGKKPASATPKKNRMASRPWKLKTAAVQIVMIPQDIIMRPIQTEGEKYFIAKFEGASKNTYLLFVRQAYSHTTSKKTYGTKNTATAML